MLALAGVDGMVQLLVKGPSEAFASTAALSCIAG